MSVRASVQIQEDWLVRLRAGCEAGYYKTEAALGQQIGFPWQNKTCSDCPFWSNSVCRVHAEYRASAAHTCIYFDELNREAADEIIRERQWQGYRRWWDWFNSR